MMKLTVQNVYGLLIRSRLLPRDAHQAMFARWQVEAKDAVADPAAFLKWLVARAYLTEFQAALLARGRADHLVLGEYKLLDRVGQGRLAGLYRAEHGLGQVVALKVFTPRQAKDPAALGRFQRAARLAMRWRHPNVVRAFQLGEAGGLHYLAVEYPNGETLAETLKRRGRLPPDEAVRLVYQALLGLQHIHEQGGVHHALQPDNLLVIPLPAKGQPDTTSQATAKLLDADLTRILEKDANPETVSVGDSDYLAPEQARDSNAADIRADVYSLGCILYHALAGRPPFPDPNPINQMIRHAQETPPPLGDFNPEVPDGLQQIVNWMMAKDPAQRYPTPERAAQALQVFLAAGTEPRPEAPAEPRMRSYLNWLQAEDQGKAAPTSAEPKPPAPAPVERPLKPLPSTPDAGSSTRADKADGKRHAKKTTPSPAETILPEAPESPELAPTWDVELVPAPPSPKVVLSVKGLVLTRRDLLMCGIGAACMAAAGLIGLAAARLSGRKANPTDSSPSEQSDGEKETK